MELKLTVKGEIRKLEYNKLPEKNFSEYFILTVMRVVKPKLRFRSFSSSLHRFRLMINPHSWPEFHVRRTRVVHFFVAGSDLGLLGTLHEPLCPSCACRGVCTETTGLEGVGFRGRPGRDPPDQPEVSSVFRGGTRHGSCVPLVFTSRRPTTPSALGVSHRSGPSSCGTDRSQGRKGSV